MVHFTLYFPIKCFKIVIIGLRRFSCYAVVWQNHIHHCLYWTR